MNPALWEAGEDNTDMRNSLDEYTRYIERTVASKQDVPTNEVVTEDSQAPSRDEDREGREALRQRLPNHLRLLMQLASEREEAAQKYYTRDFKESRRELIERLLDPTLTLEETARVLGVVPATVRRYTNRGTLPHHRTVGQQRRFRLSDVLIFLEAQQGRLETPDAEENVG